MSTPPSSVPRPALAAALERLRDAHPLVHCMTNSVVREITANVLLAAGAAPAMIDHPDESGAFARLASGLLINVGNPTGEQLEGMRAAIDAAQRAGTPWVLDPVAVGGLALRTEFATTVLADGPAAVRGNASEISALAGAGAGGRGVDTTDAVADAEPAARDLARRTGGVVAVSGPEDLIVSAERTTWLASGAPMLQLVIGTGCSLGALTAAYLGAARTAGADPHDAVVAAHAHIGVAGTLAARTASGPGSFATAWLDALHSLTADDLIALSEARES